MTQSKIIVFCGKGGVGKTSLSLSLALRCAESGKKVVVVSSHPLPELAVAVSLSGLSTEFPTAAQNLFAVYIEPRDLLADLVRNNFPSKWVAEAVLNSHIYKSLIEVAPGLKEFELLQARRYFDEALVNVAVQDGFGDPLRGEVVAHQIG